MSKEILAPYGDVLQTAVLPPGSELLDPLVTARANPISWQEVVVKLKGSVLPVLLSRVTQGRRIGLVTVDNTRPSPRLLIEVLCEGLSSLGVDYQLIVALGRHKLMSEAELHQHLGTADAAQTCWDKDTLGVRCGITKRGTPVEIHPVLQEFDLLVVVGFVEPTYLAGFSGGPKLLVPGCASAQTISFNHSLVLLTGPLPGTMEGNEVYADLREAAAMAVREPFVVCVPLNTLGEPLGLYAGGWEAHKRAAVACRQGLSVAQRDVCDIVVTSPGGAPYDVDMVQAKKALPAAVRAVKPGGTVILVAKCPRGWGAVQPDRLSLAPDGHKRLRHLADRRRLGYVDEDWASLSPAVMFWHVRRKARLIIVTDMAAELEGTIAEPAASLEEAINKCCSLRSSLTFGLISDGRRVV